MRRNLIVSIVLVALFAVVLGVGAGVQRGGAPVPAGESAAVSDLPAPLVRESSHVLSSATTEGAPTLVEFLDFECEACRAVYPLVEQIRKDYDGQLNVVVRYFPIPSHANAINAALAVEAAAQQGSFEEMYSQMYATQTEWGERQESQAGIFRGFAKDMGLDMSAYDRAVADRATLERVDQDYQDALALGVKGTPTFFLDGRLLTPSSPADLRAEIDAALAD